MNGERLALWFAASCVMLAVAGFAWMAVYDWREARRRKQQPARPTVPAPRECQPPL
jgi:hypothetical protein